MKMILPLLLPLVLFFGGCKKKEPVDGGKSTEEITAPGPKTEGARVKVSKDSLADNIVGKVMSLESEAYAGQIMQLQFNADGRMMGGENGGIEDIGLTYKIEDNEVLVFKEKERDGGISFSSSSPKVGDEVEWGPNEEKMRGKITKIEVAGGLEGFKVISDAEGLEGQLVGKWVAKVTGAKASFTFPAIEREMWSWYNKKTFPDALEYRWEVKFVDPEFGYSFGPSLFKFSDAEGPVEGSLADLINVCQHDLWKLSEDGGENIGSYGRTKVTENKVHLMVTNKTLIDYLLESKPVHVEMLITTPTFNLNEKVAVDYESPSTLKEREQEINESVTEVEGLSPLPETVTKEFIMDLWAKPHDGRDMIEEFADGQIREGIWKVMSKRGPRKGDIIDTIESTMTLKMVDRRYHVWEWREGEFLSYTVTTYDYDTSRYRWWSTSSGWPSISEQSGKRYLRNLLEWRAVNLPDPDLQSTMRTTFVSEDGKRFKVIGKAVRNGEVESYSTSEFNWHSELPEEHRSKETEETP